MMVVEEVTPDMLTVVSNVSCNVKGFAKEYVNHSRLGVSSELWNINRIQCFHVTGLILDPIS